jgi:hypothetical protein
LEGKFGIVTGGSRGKKLTTYSHHSYVSHD